MNVAFLRCTQPHALQPCGYGSILYYNKMNRNLQGDCYSCSVGIHSINNNNNYDNNNQHWKQYFLRIPQMFNNYFAYAYAGDCDLSAVSQLQLQTWQCVTCRKKQDCTANLWVCPYFTSSNFQLSSLFLLTAMFLCSKFTFIWEMKINERLVRGFTGTSAVIKCSICCFFLLFLFLFDTNTSATKTFSLAHL